MSGIAEKEHRNTRERACLPSSMRVPRRVWWWPVCTLFFLLMSAVTFPPVSSLLRAQENQVQLLRQRILEQNKRLAELRKEIESYQQQLIEVEQEKKSLQSTVSELELSQKKIATQIQITESEINTATLQIRELDIDIREKELLIRNNRDAIADSLREMNELEEETVLEALLKHDSLTEFWDTLAKISNFQESLKTKTDALRALRDELIRTRTAQEKKRQRLAQLRAELTGEKEVLVSTLTEKAQLLKETQNEEERYQALLERKRRERDKFLAEIASLEAELNYVLNPRSIPKAGRGVLSWPLEPSVFNTRCASLANALGNPYCITQYFGNTDFARRTAAYRGQGHNGIDIGVPLGTKVISALSGQVIGTGNTDEIPGCYSWGKWIVVRHNNGLTTLYAHLSQISVREGQTVNTGDLLGYSGNSGFSTGPHLHFTIYASDGMVIQKLGDLQRQQGRGRTGCSDARMPTSKGFEAYLNPLNYL